MPRLLVSTLRETGAGLPHLDKGEAMTRSGSTTPNAKRSRPMVTITLSLVALARLDIIRAERGQTRSGAIEQFIHNARLRESDPR